MRHSDVAGQLYQFSLATRSEITQSLQLPLLVISVFAAASSTLAPQYEGATFAQLTLIDYFYYGSTIGLVALSCLGLTLTLQAYASKGYVKLVVGEQFANLMTDAEGNVEDISEAEGIISSKLILAANENEKINTKRAKSRRFASGLLIGAAVLFFANISLFVVGSRV